MDYLFLKQWLSLDPFSILYVNLKVQSKRSIDNQALQRTQYKMLNKASSPYETVKQCTASLKYCSDNSEQQFKLPILLVPIQLISLDLIISMIKK